MIQRIQGSIFLTAQLWFIPLITLTFGVQASSELIFAVNPSSASQQEIYHILAHEFERRHPNIKINVVSRSLEDHKQKIKEFTTTGNSFSDVIMGYGGDQLANLAKNDRLLNIDDLWQEYNLRQQFSAVSETVVRVDKHFIAIPLNYYQWGIYYKKKIFEDALLSPPTTWQELLDAIKRLNQRDITPFSLSGGSNWSLAAWFDYLNLRLNGLVFHQDLLAGKISFLDQRVTQVFEHWRQLIELSAFDLNHLALTWQESLPYLYRDHVAMTLMGNFFVAHIPRKLKPDFAFLPFPNIDPTMPRYEDVPYDVTFIDKNSRHPELAKQFLAFLSQADTQALFSNYVGKISPNLAAKPNNENFIIEGKQLIESASGVSQFFDRDTNSEFSQAAQTLFYAFVENPRNQKQIIAQLEAYRIKYLLD